MLQCGLKLNRMDGTLNSHSIYLLLMRMYHLFLPAFSEQFDMAEIEGSHSVAENEYLILFYHRPPGSRYDRLLGHQVIHSNQ